MIRRPGRELPPPTSLELLSLGLLHDLRSPLSAAASAFHLLEGRLGAMGGEERMAWDLGRRSLAMAHEVMESWQRLISAASATVPALVEVGGVLRAVHAELAGELEAHRVRLDVSPHLPAVRAHADRLRAIFRNLLGNAARHVAGVSEPRIITITHRALAGGHRFAVRDNGPGLPEALARRAFDPFVSGPRPPGIPRGLGLGLALVRWLVALEGGSTWIRSTPGRGTTVAFFLPGSRAASARAGQANSREQSRRREPRAPRARVSRQAGGRPGTTQPPGGEPSRHTQGGQR